MPKRVQGYVATAGPRLVRAAYLLCHDRGVAEDLVQEALARLHRNWARIDREGNVDAYVWRSMINQLTSWRRRRSWHEAPAAIGERDRLASDQAELLLTARDEMWRLLALLPPRQRAVLVLRHYEDLPDRDIAVLLGCSEATVRAHVAKGVAKLLRVHLDPEGVRK